MTIKKPSEKIMRNAADLIKSGSVVSFPTETVYGLGADAFNPLAVTKIFEIKQRPFFDPIIVHIAHESQIDLIAKNADDRIRHLTGCFWPGPLTLILEKTKKVPDIVTSGLETVAVRMPRHPLAKELIIKSGTPIAAPSANRFGCISPTEAVHVHNQLGANIELILDGGKCQVGVESTIIKVEKERVILLRPGGIPVEDIESVAGPVEKASESGKPEAPGQLPYHYSPETKIKIVNNIAEYKEVDDDTAILLFKNNSIIEMNDSVEILSPKGDLREAASNLFSALHRLDSLGKKLIIAESVPEKGLGLAIMDRLNRAAKK